MKRTFTFVIAAMLSAAAFATGNPPPPPPKPSTPPINIDVSAGAGASAGATSDASAHAASTSSATGGSFSDFSKQNLYVLPAPVSAAPLPANLCPQGDSVAWSFGWNFISYSKSSTRTEMECLERVLTMIKAMSPAVPAPVLAPLTPDERAALAKLMEPKAEPVACTPPKAPAKAAAKAAAQPKAPTKPAKRPNMCT